MLRAFAITPVILLAACKPPASDDYLVRSEFVDERAAPAPPIDSPDTEGATWAPSVESGHLLYGKPGQAPLFSLGCEDGALVYTRYVAADPHAKAVLALIGNGHVERLWIDAEQDRRDQDAVWLWRGRLPADDPRLEVLTGQNRVEATVPGSGSVIFNASHRPAEFINRCAASIAPRPEPEADPA